ncbi:MAG TPA: branched-chain amino acid aminotransferase [Bacteroidales bacterium]|nr:branched-chain amino acid aminotransferase [Bacteroidales bacterium]HRR92868.1 branched-chain amino acid aminotransferase [Bacteroidales bacterium]HRT90081.1 branched-chain amino acid aminotransferase [Bacteroidales bacterium]
MEHMDWKNLPFGYMKTDYNIRSVYRNGKWGPLEISDSEYLSVHMAATGLHYGQEIFEGLKAYMGKDGRIRLFRWEENAKRFIKSAKGLIMAPVPQEMFREAIFKVISLNKKYVPPYGSGASLYIRPLLFGSGAEVGVKPSGEYMFVVFVTPVGPYFREGVKPVDMLIIRDVDRAAPKGTGTFKAGGNYAASLRAIVAARDGGYANVIFVDSVERKYIDECGPANFFAVKNNKYITPASESILESITNMSLLTLAGDMGMETERRKIAVEELAGFEEAGACGTAAVISPIARIFDPQNNKVYEFCKDGKPGPVSMKLYNRLTGIQYGDEPDHHGWITFVE